MSESSNDAFQRARAAGMTEEQMDLAEIIDGALFDRPIERGDYHTTALLVAAAIEHEYVLIRKSNRSRTATLHCACGTEHVASPPSELPEFCECGHRLKTPVHPDA